MSTMSMDGAPVALVELATERHGVRRETTARAPTWAVRVEAMLRQIDELLETMVDESAATAGPDAARWLERLERARTELARLRASDAAVAAEGMSALAALAREAPTLYAALAAAAVAMTSTAMSESTLTRAPGWGLARAAPHATGARRRGTGERSRPRRDG